MSQINLKIKLSDDSIQQIQIINNSTIEDLKFEIESKLHYDHNKQILIRKAIILDNKKSLNDYEISDNNTIILVIDNEIQNEEKKPNFEIVEEKTEEKDNKNNKEKKNNENNIRIITKNNNIIPNKKKIRDFVNKNIFKSLKNKCKNFLDKFKIWEESNENNDNNQIINPNEIDEDYYNQYYYNNEFINLNQNKDDNYSENLRKLEDMGFPCSEANKALLKKYGKIENCIDKLEN